MSCESQGKCYPNCCSLCSSEVPEAPSLLAEGLLDLTLMVSANWGSGFVGAAAGNMGGGNSSRLHKTVATVSQISQLGLSTISMLLVATTPKESGFTRGDPN